VELQSKYNRSIYCIIYRSDDPFPQKRFSLSYPRETTDDVKWFVGLTYTTETEMDFEELTPSVWLKPADEHTIMTVPEDSGWIIFNIQSSGKHIILYYIQPRNRTPCNIIYNNNIPVIYYTSVDVT